MKKLIVVAIPGIGSKQRNFSKPLEARIRQEAEHSGILDYFQLIELLPFKESDIDFNQKSLYDRMKYDNDLNRIMYLKKFVMY